MEINIATSRLYTPTEIIMDLQTEIKILIKETIYNVSKMINYNKNVDKLLEDGLGNIENETLRETARKSLKKFSQEQFILLSSNLGFGLLPVVVIALGVQDRLDKNSVQRQINAQIPKITQSEFNQAYSNLGDSQAKVARTQSLYNYSELTDRYEKQQNMVSNLKEKTNLVICDTHSDCSDRCFPWQGRVYSLDGTYGTTNDGRKYQPLENATKAKDKYGHINGLLGYNCRHKLVAYRDGLKPVKVSKSEQQLESELSSQQRLLERNIRNSKEMALSYKDINQSKYNYFKDKATQLNKEYIKFCVDNNRVEYRSRLKI